MGCQSTPRRSQGEARPTPIRAPAEFSLANAPFLPVRRLGHQPCRDAARIQTTRTVLLVFVSPQLLPTARFHIASDPSNTQADLREAFRGAGYPWVTSLTFRKTTATLMDQAGLSARAAADQLGHAHPSLTQDVYYGRKVAATGAAAVLESLG